MNQVTPAPSIMALLNERRKKGLERNLHDAALNHYAYWVAGSEFYSRFCGPFDPTMTARQAWVKLDMEGKIVESAFPEWKAGWEAAQQAYRNDVFERTSMLNAREFN